MIVVENIEKKIKGNVVLNKISCTMKMGMIYGIYGRNGSGKTMLMRAILGLIQLDTGKVIINDEIVGKDIDFPRSVGAIIETPGFFSYATGYENLKILADIKGIISEETIRDTMHRVGLDDKDKRTVSKYSLGMRQRLAIAQAVMESPDLLVLDEPTNALDDEGIDVFHKIIKDEAERGAIVVFSSHNKEDIDLLSDVKIEVSNGKIKLFGGKNDKID